MERSVYTRRSIDGWLAKLDEPVRSWLIPFRVKMEEDGLRPVQSLIRDFGVKAVDVFLVLENTSQRALDRFLAQFMSIDGDQSGRPIQRLGNARTLVEIHKAQALDQTADLFDEKTLDFEDR